jgi:hypothetical protein
MARSCANEDGDDEGLAVVRVDVRRDRAKPGHEGVREDEIHGGVP